MEAQDVRAQNEACREYFKDTSPAAWTYEGWLAYWETSSRNVLPGAPADFMHISEPRFNELRKEAALAQGVEAPAASAPRSGKASAPRQEKAAPTEAERLAQIELCRERIMREHGAEIERARVAGLLVGWRWQGSCAFPEWLRYVGICKPTISGKMSWESIIDGVFEDRNGNPKKVSSIRSSYCQRKKIFLTPD